MKHTKNEHIQLYKIMKNFEGMNKLDVFDLLHKIETLLFYCKSPLTKESITQTINSDGDKKMDNNHLQFTILSNGNFCYFEDANDWLHIYKEKKQGIQNWLGISTYYFKVSYSPFELKKLTTKNLKQSVKNTPKENTISLFLSFNSITERSKKNNRLLLLTQ